MEKLKESTKSFYLIIIPNRKLIYTKKNDHIESKRLNCMLKMHGMITETVSLLAVTSIFNYIILNMPLSHLRSKGTANAYNKYKEKFVILQAIGII